MKQDKTVTGPATLSDSFFCDTLQICEVTADFDRTLAGFIKMGICPWLVYNFSPETVNDQLSMGRPERYSMRPALADSGTTTREVFQPMDGPGTYKDFLARHGEGVKHIGEGCGSRPFEERIAVFGVCGPKMVQSETWNGVRYASFGTGDLIGAMIEIFGFPQAFVFPEPEAWFPARPETRSA